MVAGNRLLMASMVASLTLGSGCGSPDVPVDAASGGVDTGATPLDAPGLDAPGADAASPTGVLIRAAEGGLVESADGLFEIYVFPGALAEDTTISIARVADSAVPADVAATEPISAVYSVEPDGLTFGGDGALAHFHFEATPSSMRRTAPVEMRGAAFAATRPAGGGTIEWQADPRTVHRETGAMDLYASLAHLSLQWALGRSDAGADFWVGADFGEHEYEVGDTWRTPMFLRASVLAVGVPGVFTTVRGVVSPEVSVSWGPETELLPGIDLEGGFVHDTLAGATAFSSDLDPDVDLLVTPYPRWSCDEPGSDHRIVRGEFQARRLAPSVLFVDPDATTCAPRTSAEVSILDTIHAQREELLVSIGLEPVLEARVETRPATTRTVSVPSATGGDPSGWFATLSPAADPPAAGPGPITATNSGATMTATPDAMTGEYVTVIDDPAIWQSDAPTRFTLGGTVSDVMPPAEPRVTFGSVAGLDTMIVPSAPDAELDVRLRFPGTTTCMGEDVEDLVIFRRLDGSTVGIPVREGVELAAALCGRTVEELTAASFYVEAGTRSSKVVDVGGLSLRVTTGRTYEIDGTALTATCPMGRTYCTDTCVNTATDPMNCGGCGLTPAEICNGADDDCDGMVDDGCPNAIAFYSSDTTIGPTFGEGGGSGTYNAQCSFPSLMLGICVNVDTATGNLRSIRPRCGNMLLDTNTSVTPHQFTLVTTASGTPGDGCGTGGGSSGGTPFEHSCGPGEVVDTITGQAGMEVGQLAFRCARWEVVAMPGGVWGIARTTTSMSPTFGTGGGTSFMWRVDDHAVSGFPGMIRHITGRHWSPGNLLSIQARGSSGFLRLR